MMRAACLLLLLCWVSRYNCAEIFVPRFTAGNGDEASRDHIIKDVDAVEKNENSVETETEIGLSRRIFSNVQSIFDRLFHSTKHWYSGENVCKEESMHVKEQNASQSHFARFISTRKCLESDGGEYKCETRTNNGTHIVFKVEKYVCCPGYHIDMENKQCVAVVIKPLSEVLKTNNASQFEEPLENVSLNNRTIFVFPNDGSPVDEETIKTHTLEKMVHLSTALDQQRILTESNTSIILSVHQIPEEMDYTILANCKKIISANNYISNDTIVNVVEARLPTPSLSTLEYIASNPKLSEAYGLIDSVILPSDNYGLGEDDLYTAFVPTNEAIQKYRERWPSFGEDKEALRSIISYHMVDCIACAGHYEGSPITANEVNDTIVFKYREARISEANIVTKNGIVHILDEIIELPFHLRPLEAILEKMEMDEFLNAYNKIKEEFSDDEKHNLTVFLPQDDTVGYPYASKEIRRHIVPGVGKNLLNDAALQKLNVYGHVQFPGIFQQLTLNCVPVSASERFKNGHIIGVSQRIPQGFPDIFAALESTGEHKLFSKLVEKYLEKHGNISDFTMFAIKDSALIKGADSLPQGIRGILGTEETSKDEHTHLEEFMRDLILTEKLCMYTIRQQESLPAMSGKYHRVHSDKFGVRIGQAEVDTSDMVTPTGIIHSLNAIPKARHIPPVWAVWGHFPWLFGDYRV